MTLWNRNYVSSLQEDFKSSISDLPDRLEAITDGRVVPEVEELSLGGARRVRGAVLFFDIRGFTNRTGSPDTESLKRTLYMINSLIPTIMKIVHEHGGYIEKNTGDGIMAVIGAEAGIADAEAAAVAKASAVEEKQAVLSEAQKEAQEIDKRAQAFAKEKEAQIVADAQTKASEVIKDAESKSALLKEQALKESEAEIAKLAILAAEKVLREKAS